MVEQDLYDSEEEETLDGLYEGEDDADGDVDVDDDENGDPVLDGDNDAGDNTTEDGDDVCALPRFFFGSRGRGLIILQ